MGNLQKKKNKLEINKESRNRLKKIGFFFCFFLPFLWAVYDSGPNIIFSYDKTKGEATIIQIRNSCVEFEYFHEFKNKKIKLNYKQRNIKKIEQLKNKAKWEILYSKNFPKRVSIVDIDTPPVGLPSFIFILIFALPLIFFKNFDFD